MPSTGPRKRPASGPSPIQQQPASAGNRRNEAPQMAPDQYLQWNQQNVAGSAPRYSDPTGNFASNSYNGMSQDQAIPPNASNQLARRPLSQHLVTRANFNNAGDDAWPIVAEDGMRPPQDQAWLNNNEKLDHKARIARRNTQAKRKQIPPFVQKLSSFLDESRNTELIRWSDTGDSFIVVDEDEFAKSLIPELFKHNNYASFVRQLNMYGFHKKVGLSDNSMRASERKNKSPSEYSNPYFKRGRPNLLWLIQKPKNPQGKGGSKGSTRIKQENDNADEEGEEVFDSDGPAPLNHGLPEFNPSQRTGRQPLMIEQGGGTLPQGDVANIQRELHAIRQQQQVIASMLSRTREDHRKLYGQAAAFQSLHDRHESSINAILTFLATVYNRSLEGQGGPNFANMFATAIPHDPQGPGNVVDVGEFGDKPSDSNGQSQRLFRKQPLLLKAPPSNSQNGQMGGANIASPVESPLQHRTSRLHPTQNQRYPYSMHSPAAQSPAIQELSDQSHSNRSSASPQVKPKKEISDGQIPEADIMSLINSANANNTSFPTAQRMDFPQALSHLQTADGKSPLTPNQRHDVLQLMANDSANTAQNNNVNALTFPSPPLVPDMAHYNLTKDQLEFIGNSLKEQEHKVQELNEILAPLSPSGSIPGVNDPQAYGGTDMLDLDQIFNSGDYFNDGLGGNGVGGGAGLSGNGIDDIDFGNGDGLGDFNFEASMAQDGGGGMGNQDGGFRNGYHTAVNEGSDNVNADEIANGSIDRGSAIETINSSEATSPANTIDEGGGPEERSSPKKRRAKI
ncbi:stress-responsive transcription factor hsf1 [Pseudocyphellaria aurata]|nr:stress-responsive transcription factor hsf1 [Pseudocyphellaria aurata]